MCLKLNKGGTSHNVEEINFVTYVALRISGSRGKIHIPLDVTIYIVK